MPIQPSGLARLVLIGVFPCLLAYLRKHLTTMALIERRPATVNIARELDAVLQANE
jgi:hypothetical protein